MRVVYVTYDGLKDPLGESQILPYLRALAARGHAFDVVSFEKRPERLRVREELAPGIRWTALRYHKAPTVPATAFDMAQGAAATALAALVRRADLVHVRALVPGAMALPWVTLARKPLLFDSRAFWADERVDIGMWSSEGRLYRTAKAIERALLRSARATTVLTNKARDYLREEYPYRDEIRGFVRVIPTCADLEAFHPRVPPDAALARELDGCTVLAYVGSMGGFYMPAEMVRFYLAWRKLVERPRLLVVTRMDPAELRDPIARAGFGDEVLHRAARREQVAPYVRCADASMCLILPVFSKRASAATKLGELLGCGVPVVVNATGDMERVVRGSGAGVVLDATTEEAIERAARELVALQRDPAVELKARRLAERWFSLSDAVDAYDRLYRDVRFAGGGRDGRWPPCEHAEKTGTDLESAATRRT